jgi:hypothetical protein
MMPSAAAAAPAWQTALRDKVTLLTKLRTKLRVKWRDRTRRGFWPGCIRKMNRQRKDDRLFAAKSRPWQITDHQRLENRGALLPSPRDSTTPVSAARHTRGYKRGWVMSTTSRNRTYTTLNALSYPPMSSSSLCPDAWRRRDYPSADHTRAPVADGRFPARSTNRNSVITSSPHSPQGRHRNREVVPRTIVRRPSYRRSSTPCLAGHDLPLLGLRVRLTRLARFSAGRASLLDDTVPAP